MWTKPCLRSSSAAMASMSESSSNLLMHGRASLEDHLQELALVILGVVGEQQVGKDLVVRLGQLVEVHGFSGAKWLIRV